MMWTEFSFLPTVSAPSNLIAGTRQTAPITVAG
jgi:hypothetical protein